MIEEKVKGYIRHEGTFHIYAKESCTKCFGRGQIGILTSEKRKFPLICDCIKFMPVESESGNDKSTSEGNRESQTKNS